jgi:hypothetical protein
LIKWGLGAFGQPGVERVLAILRAETRTAMQQLGAPLLEELTPFHASADIHRRQRDDDHLLRRIDQLLDLECVSSELKPFYGTIGCPTVTPELTIRMLVIGY